MKIFISASVVSVMVFYSSLLPVLHSLSLYFSATIHKNYMFLLCNGLLVFIVRNSGLISSYDHQQAAASLVEDSKKVESKVEDGEERENGLVLEREIKSFTEEGEDRKKRQNGSIVERVEEEEEEDVIFVAEETDEEEEEEEIGILSKEELNKKCEEFIRKMKAGIKFESQQQQLLVF